MKKENEMKKVSVFMCLLGVLMAGSAAQATWEYIDYPGSWGNMVNNATNTEGYAYSEVKPVSGPWTVSHIFGNANAAINSDPIYIWSARNISFNDWNYSRGGASGDSYVILKFNLSQNITSATWSVPGVGGNPGNLIAKYSTDGTNWTDAYVYGVSSQNPVTLNTGTTNVLFLQWDSPTGSWWDCGGMGTLTLVPEPASLALMIGVSILGLRKRG